MTNIDGRLADQDPHEREESGTYAATIELAHLQVEPALEALEAFFVDDKLLEPARFFAIRVRLACANLARAQVSQQACNHLLSGGRGDDLQALREIRDREQEHSQKVSSHIQHWTPQLIQRDWIGYRRDTKAIFAQVRELIALERKTLLPLLRDSLRG